MLVKYFRKDKLGGRDVLGGASSGCYHGRHHLIAFLVLLVSLMGLVNFRSILRG